MSRPDISIRGGFAVCAAVGPCFDDLATFGPPRKPDELGYNQSMSDIPPSKTAVRNAGSTIRAFMRGERAREELEQAVQVVLAYRAQFSDPLVVVQERLRQIHHDLNMQGEVSQRVTQRLKKAPTILDKLVREDGLNLSRMQDIGGCRMVVESIDHVRLVEQAVMAAWGEDVDHVKDYITTPRSSGYRGVHVVVIESGLQIEIQLRTESMHVWAQLVEAFSGLEDHNFKQDGDHIVQEFLRQRSAVDALLETGQNPTDEQFDKLSTLGKEVTKYLDASSEARKDTK